MSNIEYVDRHEAKIRSITMEAPEGYEFGHVVKAEVELRVGKLEYSTDKEGNMIRTAVLVVEGCHIKEAMDPAQAYSGDPVSATASVDSPDDDDDDDAPAPQPTTDAGEAVDPETGEIDREPVGAGVGAGVDPEIGF